MPHHLVRWIVPLVAAVGLLAPPVRARAHCDGLDGPVVKAAQKALQVGDVNLVLPWVHEPDEALIREAFKRTSAVRKLGPEAQKLADTWFFETLVRVHRATEGAPFTGLQPAGRDLGPAIPAADLALETGKAASLEKLLESAMREGLEARFARTMRAKAAAKDVEAGRRFVASYVEYVHYVERLYEAAIQGAEGHHAERAHAAPH